METFKSKIEIKIGKKLVELKFTYDGYQGIVSCKDDELEFDGTVTFIEPNYNKTSIGFWQLQKEFTFFKEEIRDKVVKILIKEKFLKKRNV